MREIRGTRWHFWALGGQLASTAMLLLLAGCSTAPCADFLDFCSPGRFPKDAKGATGGVCIPQGGPAGGILGAPQPIAPPVAPPIGPPPFKGNPMPTGEPPPPAPIGATPLSSGPK